MSSLIVKTAPTQEPITLQDAKDHLRVATDDDDAYITNLIRTARFNLERAYDLALITQSLVLGRDYFPAVFGMGWGWTPSWWLGTTWMAQYDTQEMRYGYINLRPPVQSITQVTYLDTTGASQVWASSNYVLDSDSRPARFMLNIGKTFPATAPLLGAVKVEFVAGYTTQALVPDDIKQALRLLIGNWYENRESVVVDTRLVALELPQSVQMLMAPYAPQLVR